MASARRIILKITDKGVAVVVQGRSPSGQPFVLAHSKAAAQEKPKAVVKALVEELLTKVSRPSS